MTTTPMKRSREFKWLPREDIIKNENNPREEGEFSATALEQLRRSINAHGILEPLIVTPYDGQYKLLEGERRWATAKLEDISEVPAVVVNKMSELDELTVMFNIHGNRRGWKVAEELVAIKRLREANPDASLEDLAAQLGIGSGTLRERLAVLDMGDNVIADIARDKIEYSSAMRAHQVTGTITRKRPELVEKLGGEKVVEKMLLDKAKARGRGISQELVELRKDFADTKSVLDADVEQYLRDPSVGLKTVRAAKSVEEKREVEALTKKVRRLDKDLRDFNAELGEAPNLRDLRGALSGLIEAAQLLEIRASRALKKQDDRKQ